MTAGPANWPGLSGRVATAAHLSTAIVAADADDQLIDHTGRLLRLVAASGGMGMAYDHHGHRHGRRDGSPERAADVLFGLLNPRLYLLFARDRGWSAVQWEQWAYDTPHARLCSPAEAS